VELAVGLTLMTIDIPFWQCFPWEQYSHMGVVLLTKMVYVGVSVAVAATAMKPEKIPVVLECKEIGWHGASKVD